MDQLWAKCHDGKTHLFDLDDPDKDNEDGYRIDDTFTSACGDQTIDRQQAEDGEWDEHPPNACHVCFSRLGGNP